MHPYSEWHPGTANASSFFKEIRVLVVLRMESEVYDHNLYRHCCLITEEKKSQLVG